MKLYTYYRSQASFRVRIALNLKGLQYQPVFVHLPKGEHRAAQFDRIPHVRPRPRVAAVRPARRSASPLGPSPPALEGHRPRP